MANVETNHQDVNMVLFDNGLDDAKQLVAAMLPGAKLHLTGPSARVERSNAAAISKLGLRAEAQRAAEARGQRSFVSRLFSGKRTGTPAASQEQGPEPTERPMPPTRGGPK